MAECVSSAKRVSYVLRCLQIAHCRSTGIGVHPLAHAKENLFRVMDHTDTRTLDYVESSFDYRTLMWSNRRFITKSENYYPTYVCTVADERKFETESTTSLSLFAKCYNEKWMVLRLVNFFVDKLAILSAGIVRTFSNASIVAARHSLEENRFNKEEN